MSKPASADVLEDPALRAAVERALEPYKGELSLEALGAMRAYLEDVLLTHPLGQTLLQRVRPREPRAKSDERVRSDAFEPVDNKEKKKERRGTEGAK